MNVLNYLISTIYTTRKKVGWGGAELNEADFQKGTTVILCFLSPIKNTIEKKMRYAKLVTANNFTSLLNRYVSPSN